MAVEPESKTCQKEGLGLADDLSILTVTKIGPGQDRLFLFSFINSQASSKSGRSENFRNRPEIVPFTYTSTDNSGGLAVQVTADELQWGPCF